ncbi:dihydropteroate synthase [Paenibacillus allorhizosphaerae]|uniref:Dihydropteroate synthase n=1 Tax=Paenibacillus allorhizosphaerae TaxID=2849866 RepID=A0ABM8VSE8_9BACL|nr:dihydropteroate synthase [Paenibacillus allorhizosphaerae]CAG7656398.1 Dihydropteroate synthase [Paenibacillus allorhizosphaerae]
MSNQATIICPHGKLDYSERTLIMGILNVTPDSFSDGGKYIDPELAVERAKQLIEDGADLLDIGGESTRPGFAPVTLEEELSRVIPAIRAIRAAGLTIPISVDTYKAETGRQALEAGADLLNDIWGLQRDPFMGEVAATYGCPIVLMHNRNEAVYANFIHDVVDDLRETVRRALAAGIREEQIILDPGIGFAKSYEQNLQLMNHLDRIVELGYPVLLGTSRKSMIQRTLQLPANDAIEGTAATVALGIAQGCQIVRVHDVKEMKRVARMTDAIRNAQ